MSTMTTTSTEPDHCDACNGSGIGPTGDVNSTCPDCVPARCGHCEQRGAHAIDCPLHGTEGDDELPFCGYCGAETKDSGACDNDHTDMVFGDWDVETGESLRGVVIVEGRATKGGRSCLFGRDHMWSTACVDASGRRVEWHMSCYVCGRREEMWPDFLDDRRPVNPELWVDGPPPKLEIGMEVQYDHDGVVAVALLGDLEIVDGEGVFDGKCEDCGQYSTGDAFLLRHQVIRWRWWLSEAHRRGMTVLSSAGFDLENELVLAKAAIKDFEDLIHIEGSEAIDAWRASQ